MLWRLIVLVVCLLWLAVICLVFSMLVCGFTWLDGLLGILVFCGFGFALGWLLLIVLVRCVWMSVFVVYLWDLGVILVCFVWIGLG